MVELDPWTIDFNTAIALRGRLEQNKLEEEAMEDAKTSSKRSSRKSSSSSKKMERAEGLAEKLKRAKTIDQVVAERRRSKPAGVSQ